MKEGTVTDVVEKNFKSGTSEKTGKAWHLHKYKSGEITFNSFDDLEIGDVVRLEQNEYGWNGKKPTAQDKNHDEIMKALREIYALVKKLTDG